MDISQFIISEDTTIQGAVMKLNENGHGILFICDGRNLKAVLSDGDFRRSMLGSADMKGKVEKIANYNPKKLYLDETVDYVEYMKLKQITALPIVDEKDNIVRIEFANGDKAYNLLSEKIDAVIMAGGKGTRLYPYTKILPKPLIPIGDKTITEHIIDRFSNVGCEEFFMIVNYKKNFIKAYFQENENNTNIKFIDENEYYGTGGGLRLLNGVMKRTFFMTNCDIIVEADYSDILEYHKAHMNLVTMVCAKKKVQIPYGTVEVNDKNEVQLIKEKPEYTFLTNTGLYVLEPEFLQKIPEKEFIHITDVIEKCIDEGEHVGVYSVDDTAWMDMGQLEELEKMRRRISP